MKLLILLVITLGGLGCNQALASNQPLKEVNSLFQQNREADEDNIREAVFRYLLPSNTYKHQQSVGIYFLSIGDNKELSNEFMQRFKGNNPEVKSASQAIVSDMYGVKDEKTGRKGVILNLGQIKWKNKNEVEVSGGYYTNGLAASENIYLVVRENKKWRVKKETNLWVA